MDIAPPIKRVAIVGGTHGNELIGAYLVKQFMQSPTQVQRPTIEPLTILANPKAFAARRRYLEKDLNRCFLPELLQDSTLTSYEDQQARAIYQQLFPSPGSGVDVILDLHSTTANMGLTLIPASAHPFNLQLAAHLTSRHPELKVYRWSDSTDSSPFLRSLSPLGCAIEVGPVPQGVLDAQLFHQTRQLIDSILDYIDAHNRGISLTTHSPLDIYQCVEMVDYPRDSDGELQAMIHPQLQARDYQLIHPGDPVFITFEGAVIAYNGRSPRYPVFINEAAYYEKGIAFCLTEKRQVLQD